MNIVAGSPKRRVTSTGTRTTFGRLAIRLYFYAEVTQPVLLARRIGAVLTVTGVYLMFFYVPSATQAYTNILDIQSQVTFGLLTRNIHRWAAHLMVFFVFLHMMRVFYHGAYKPPREFNWVVGVILLTLTLLLSFTGYLLPWDQLAIWAVTVGTEMMGFTPVFGKQVQFVLLGGVEIGPNTLLRWYVLHVLFVPFVTVIFLAVHFWRIRKDGGISGPL